jgi:site-specific recombinase XerD
MNHKHYRDWYDVKGDGRIILYKRDDVAKPVWQARVKIPSKSGYKIKSTKTNDLHTAVRFGEDLYYELEGRVRRGEAIDDIRFDKLISEWLADNKVRLRDRTPEYQHAQKRTVENYILPFFSKMKLADIDFSTFRSYFSHRIETQSPASTTLIKEGQILRNAFGFALQNGYINKLPKIDLPAKHQTPRQSFERKEWNQLVQYLRRYVDKGISSKHSRIHRQRVYLRHFIYILGNSGIRPGTESRNLLWRDVSEASDMEGNKVAVFSVRGKACSRKVICLPGVERHLDMLRAFRKQELGKEPHKNEPIFCNVDGKATGSYKKGYQAVLREYDLLEASDGSHRVPYSLRHTYITLQRLNGVDVYWLAANCGTSVEMIEKFYSDAKNTSPEAITEITKAKRAALRK